MEAVQEDEGFLLFKILDLRMYARAKEVYDRTPMDKRPRNAAMDMVSEVEFELAKERIARLRKPNG